MTLRRLRLFLLLSLVVLTAGAMATACGNKGPLYLPERQQDTER